MGFAARQESPFVRAATWIALVVLGGCTTHVPLSDDYRGPDALPERRADGLTASCRRSRSSRDRRRRSTRARALRRAPAVAAVGRGLLRSRSSSSTTTSTATRARPSSCCCRSSTGSSRSRAFSRATSRTKGGLPSSSRAAAIRSTRSTAPDGDRARQPAGLPSRARLDRARARARCVAHRRVRREPGRDGCRHADGSRSARELARDRDGRRRLVVSVGQHELSARRRARSTIWQRVKARAGKRSARSSTPRSSSIRSRSRRTSTPSACS